MTVTSIRLMFRLAYRATVQRVRWLASSAIHTVGIVVYVRQQRLPWRIGVEVALTSYGPFLERRKWCHRRWVMWREYRRISRAWPDLKLSLREMNAEMERAYRASQLPPSVDISALVTTTRNLPS